MGSVVEFMFNFALLYCYNFHHSVHTGKALSSHARKALLTYGLFFL